MGKLTRDEAERAHYTKFARAGTEAMLEAFAAILTEGLTEHVVTDEQAEWLLRQTLVASNEVDPFLERVVEEVLADRYGPKV